MWQQGVRGCSGVLGLMDTRKVIATPEMFSDRPREVAMEDKRQEW